MLKRERLPETRTKNKARGRPFPKGNPGRPPGSKNKATLIVQQLVEGQAEQLTRKALELAQAGDVGCLRFLLNQLSPARRSQSIAIDIPAVRSAEDVPALRHAIWAAVNDGQVTAEEVVALATLLDRTTQMFEAEELARQLDRLEKEEDITS